MDAPLGTTYRLVDGRVVIEVEDLLGTAPTGGWVYQAPGVGNAGAVGAHYYYRSETLDGSHKSAPQEGRFSFQVEVDEPGTYSILLRAARDISNPGDARNDIWIKVDDDTESVMPDGSPTLTTGGEGFVKFKGGLGAAWRDANQFSTPVEGDVNPRSTVMLEAGVHTITFAPRSTGLHIDSVQIVARDTTPLPDPPDPVDPPPDPVDPPPDSAPLVRVWLSHDGYRDPDDNLAMLLGAAQARSVAQSGSDVRVAGVVFGDTKDGGQFHMLNPEAATPAAFGEDFRYGDVAGNQRAAGNYAFFREYGLAALADLGPGWKNYDLLAGDQGGLRTWNFHATGLEQLSAAAAALALDIADAIARTAGAEQAAKLVVYSAGGGANVAAEAVGYLLGQGYAMADLAKHFAVVQHGNNWVTNYEEEARALTRDLTIAITNQNYATYADGTAGPDLKHAIPAGSLPDGSGFGAAFAQALSVATGVAPFAAALPAGAGFRTTLDASDAGSHAFATDVARLLGAWDQRIGAGDLHTGYDWAHLIDDGPLGLRSRVLYDGFDAAAVAALLAGGGAPEPEPVTVTAAVAASEDDYESLGGTASPDLDLGRNGGAAGWQPNPAGLRVTGLELAAGADLLDAYFLFQAARDSGEAGSLTIEIEASRSAAGFAGADAFASRSYLAEAVAWDAPGAWEAGQFYRSPDLSALIEAVIGDGGLAAADALAFRVSGTGVRAAHAFDSDGAAPQLVVTALAGAFAGDEDAEALPVDPLLPVLPDDLV